MRAVVQRVREASVQVGERRVAAIGAGLLVLVAIRSADTAEDRDWLVRKIAQLRVFDDDAGVMNRSVHERGGDVLAVSQFTLYASTRKGNRPSWSAAAPPDVARPLFEDFVVALSSLLRKAGPAGEFGAHMQVALVNDGPVTIWLDSAARD